MTTMIKAVNKDNFVTEVLERSNEVPVIVDFWAEWCGPCKTLGPTLERLTTEAGGAVELAKIDVDQNQELAQQFGVQSIPTVIAFRDGKPVNQFTGALPETQVRDFMAALSPSELDMAVARAEELLDRGRDQEASALLSEVLTADPTNQDAGVMLAGILLDAGETTRTVDLLGTLQSTEEVRALVAAAKMTESADVDIGSLETAAIADPNDHGIALQLAKARAATGEHEPALEALLAIVEAQVEESDDARLTMIDLFDLLGVEDSTVATYRRKLATAIF